MNNMVLRPLPVTDMTQKLQSKNGSPNPNFALQVGIYRPPSESPPNLSDESDYEHLMAMKTRNAEAPTTSRSCSSSSSVDENVSNLQRNVDKHNEADIDSEDGLSSDNEVIRRASSCSTLNQMDICEQCGLLRKNARPDLYPVKDDNNIRHCICYLVGSYQPKPANHQRLKHRLNKVAVSRSSSHDSTVNASPEAGSYSPYLNSAQGDLSFVKDEDEDMEDANCDTLPTNDASTFLANTTDVFNGGKTKNRNKIRQEVDPRKYIVVVDGLGTKYACSQCVNIKMYTWRKSLNKHWKEKHNAIKLVEVTNTTAVNELMKTGKYTIVGAQLYCTAYLRTIQSTGSCATSTHAKVSYSVHQPDMLNISTSLPSASDFNSPHTPSFSRMVGPFSTAHTALHGFPETMHFLAHGNYYDSSEIALDLSCGRNHSSRNSSISGTPHRSNTLPSDQEHQINFSKGKSSVENATPEIPAKHVSVMPSCSIGQSVKNLTQCFNSESSSASETESGTNSHMHKRFATCHECKLQIESMDKLNKHFTKHHIQKLSDYKEAVKKIPHGLQQAYHLLNMELNDIVALGSPDLGLPDGMSLECKKCNFKTRSATDFQRHIVSHAEERPYVCMICGATYKFKWDLVKHFEKSHTNLPNPYRRNDRKDASDESSEEDKPLEKEAKFEQSSANMNNHPRNRNDIDSVEAVTNGSSGPATASCQQTGLGSAMEKKHIDQLMGPTVVAGAHKEHMAHTCQTQQQNDRSHKTHAEETEQHMSHNDGHVCCGETSRAMRKDSDSPRGSKPEKTLKSQRKLFQCNTCDMEFRFLSELQQHRKKHSNFKPYMCRFCDYSSKWKWDTAKHEKRCPGRCTNHINTNKPDKVQTSMNTGLQNATGNKRRRIDRTTRQPPFPCTDQSTNESASFLSYIEAQDDSPKSRTKALSKRKNQSNANNSNSNVAMVNKNHTAQANGLQLANLKQTIPTTSTEDVIPSSSSSIASAKPSVSRARRSGDVSSSASWKCSECTFMTHTQVEFKRHSQEVHNNDKPFKCDFCGYSSRWPGDLKKHKQLYNHFPETEIEGAQKFRPLFKCFLCAIYFDTLEKLTDHCLTQHGEEIRQNSAVSLMENDVDIARFKHPRKRVTHIQCSQCPFICTSPQIMNTHLIENMHCCYCKSVFREKEPFFHHLIQHPEFTPKEWEVCFMISEAEQRQLKTDTETNQRADNKPGKHYDTMEFSQNHSTSKDEKKRTTGADPSLNRIQPMQVEIEKFDQEKPQFNMYTCEWCHAEFMILTAVYNHASCFHQAELKEQAARMTMTNDARL